MITSSGGGGYPSSAPLSGNTSAAALVNATPFTGVWTIVPVGSLLTVTVASDADLTVSIQYSVDGGVTTDSTLNRYFRVGQIFPPQNFKNARPYVRVVVTNTSGVAATYTRINTYLGAGEPILNIPIDATMSQNYSAISTRPTSFNDEVALGRRQGWETWNKFGYNLDVDSGSAEIVASWGGTFARMTSADTLSVVSSSAADDGDPVGTGARSIIIYGIDENRDLQTEIVTMNGTTPVVTANQWLGVNRIAIYTVGSGEENAGTITATATSAGSTQGQMPVASGAYEGGVTQQCIFHVPRNHIFLASYLRFNVNKISGGGSPVVTIRGIVYSAQNGARQQVWAETIDTSVDNFIDLTPAEPFPISEQTILYFEATTDTANTIVGGRFSGKLVRDLDA